MVKDTKEKPSAFMSKFEAGYDTDDKKKRFIRSEWLTGLAAYEYVKDKEGKDSKMLSALELCLNNIGYVKNKKTANIKDDFKLAATINEYTSEIMDKYGVGAQIVIPAKADALRTQLQRKNNNIRKLLDEECEGKDRDKEGNRRA